MLSMKVTLLKDPDDEFPIQVWVQPPQDDKYPIHSSCSFILGVFANPDLATDAVAKIFGIMLIVDLSYL